MWEKEYILFKLAKSRGFSDALCLYLHAKEVECISYIWFPCHPPYVDVLAEAIEDGIEVKNILNMSMGNMDYVLRDDCADTEEESRAIDRECAMASGKEAYEALLKPNGDFDYQKAYREIIEKHPDFPDIMKKSGHPLPL